MLVLIITLLWLAVTLLILSITLLILIISLLWLTVSLLILSITLLILTISLLWLAVALLLAIALILIIARLLLAIACLLLAIACLLLAIICLLLRLCVACLLLRLCVACLLLRLTIVCLLCRIGYLLLVSCLPLCVACLLLCESRLLRRGCLLLRLSIACLLLRVTRLSVILNRTIHQIPVKGCIAVVVRRRNTVHPGNLALIRLPCQHEVIESCKEVCEYENDQNCNAGTVSKQRSDLAEGCPRCQKRNDYEHKARTVCDGSGKPAGGCACRIILFQLESCRKAGGINESATHKDQIESPIAEG